MPGRNLGRVSASMPAQDGASKRARMTSRVVSALEELPDDQAASVAQAIDRITHEDGKPFKPRDAADGERYMVMVPSHRAAPVVLYREDDEGYLITGLLKRADYRTYTQPPSPTGFLDSPAGQAALIAAGALVIAYLLSRGKSGSPTESAGTTASAGPTG
jgi:hypothetical protein